MKKFLMLLVVFGTFEICLPVNAQGDQAGEQKSVAKDIENEPWIGKYPMSFFTKTRSAKTVGKDHLSVSLKIRYFDWDRKKGIDKKYHSLPSGDSKKKLITVFCAKYGWAENHHLAIGIPMFFNDFDTSGTINKSEGIGNIFLFEKWNLIKETNNCPAVAVDFWYFLPTGDTDRKLGTDDGAYKITTEVSKAWRDFSLHFNPGYTWNETKNANISEINAVLLLTVVPKLLPALEYNYYYKENAGHRHDLVPGIIWKFAKGATFKIGVPINLESTETYKDSVGIVTKIFYRF